MSKKEAWPGAGIDFMRIALAEVNRLDEQHGCDADDRTSDDPQTHRPR